MDFKFRYGTGNSMGTGFDSGLGTPALVFESTWDTTNVSAGSSNADQIALPLYASGSYDFVVDWGDGSTNRITAWNQAEATHTYTASGVKTLKIVGKINGWRFNDGLDKLKITNVAQWGCLDFRANGATMSAFYGCANLNSTATDSPLVGDNLYRCFMGCTSLTGGVANWNVFPSLNFAQMFSGASAFNGDVSAWNVSCGEYFNYMFINVTAFAGDVSAWDVSSAISLFGVFYGCPNFNSDVSGWNTSNATSMNRLFYGATSFDRDLSAWDVTSLTDAELMFNNVTLSTANYDALLIGWEAQSVQDNVLFHGGSSTYSAGAATTARTNLDTDHNWTITDGGPA